MSKFKVWIDNPSVQIEDAEQFASNSQRVNGFVPNTVISSTLMNTALRQANLVAVALMEALNVSDDVSVSSSVESMTAEILSKLKQTVLTSAANDFVPNYTGAVGSNRLYGINPTGQNTTFIGSYAPSPGSVPLYDAVGTLSVNPPTEAYHVAPKLYVDNAIAIAMLYRHTISLSKYSDDRGIGVLNCSFEVISSRRTAFSTLSELASIFPGNNMTVSANYYYADGTGIVRLNILASQNICEFWIDGVILNSDNVPIAKSIHTNDPSYILNVSIYDAVTAL